MNYLVCIKQVPDTVAKILIENEGQNLNLSNVKWIINPYDEMALEEALILSQKDLASSQSSRVQVLSLGPTRVKEALRTALAMGAHQAIHIETKEQDVLDSFNTAKAIHTVLKDQWQDTDVILCGKHSIDYGSASMGSMLASFLNWPSVNPVIQIKKQEDILEVHRPFEGGKTQILKIKIPLLLCVTKGINEPRYPTLPGIMKAKSKPLKTFNLPEDLNKFISIEKFEYPEKRPPVQILEGSPDEQAQKLIKILKETKGIL